VSAVSYSNDSLLAVGTYAPGSIYVYDRRSSTQQPAGTIINGMCLVGHGKSHARKKRRFVSISTSNSNDQPSAADDDNESADVKGGGADSSNANETKDDVSKWFAQAKQEWYWRRAVQAGVTQLRFGTPGCRPYTLYSAQRHSNAILAWDLRMLSGLADHTIHPIQVMASYPTSADTAQRLEFDLNDTGEQLVVGGTDRCVRFYSVVSGESIGKISDGFDDVCNGVSLARCVVGGTGSHQQSFLAVATGSRRFPNLNNNENHLEHGMTSQDQRKENAPGYLRLYRIKT